MKSVVAVAIGLAALPVRGFADDGAPAAPAVARPASHWGIGAGGFSAVTGPASYGLSLGGELYPGGAFGRYGLRAEFRGYDDGEDGHAAVGVAFIAAASRPRLQLALHGDVGLTYERHLPTMGFGVLTQLWVRWPVAVGADASAVLFVDGDDTSLAVSSSLQLRIAY